MNRRDFTNGLLAPNQTTPMHEDEYGDLIPQPGTHLFEFHKTIRWTFVAWFIHAVIIAIAVDQLTNAKLHKMFHDIEDLQRMVEVLADRTDPERIEKH